MEILQKMNPIHLPLGTKFGRMEHLKTRPTTYSLLSIHNTEAQEYKIGIARRYSVVGNENIQGKYGSLNSKDKSKTLLPGLSGKKRKASWPSFFTIR